MDAKTYQAAALSTVSNGYHPHLVHPYLHRAAIGMVTEASKLLNAIKKSLFHGVEIDKDHLTRHLADVLWHVALACEGMDIELGDVMRASIGKLKAEHPECFPEDPTLNAPPVEDEAA